MGRTLPGKVWEAGSIRDLSGTVIRGSRLERTGALGDHGFSLPLSRPVDPTGMLVMPLPVWAGVFLSKSLPFSASASSAVWCK